MSEVGRAFGDRLAELRTAAGLTQDQLADRAGLHRSEISNLEGAKNAHAPRLDTAVKLAGALEKDLCELLKGLPTWTPPARTQGSFGQP